MHGDLGAKCGPDKCPSWDTCVQGWDMVFHKEIKGSSTQSRATTTLALYRILFSIQQQKVSVSKVLATQGT